MSATITISLSELIASDARARLQTALASRAAVVIPCTEDARLPVALLYAALEATAATSGFLRFEGLSANARLALQAVDPDHLCPHLRQRHPGQRHGDKGPLFHHAQA